MRQPHSVTKDESWPQVMNMNVASAEPMSRPVAVEAGTSEQYRPRWLDGAYSARKVAAPAYSPEAENDCTMRRHRSRIGARMPTASKVGRRPITKVAADIMRMEVANAHLRPFLSPMCPQKKAPTGRMRKDSANTPKVSSSATVGSPGGMSTSAMTVAK